MRRLFFARSRSLAFSLVLLCIGLLAGSGDWLAAFSVALMGMVIVGIGEEIEQQAPPPPEA